MASASDYSSSSVCYNKKKSNSNELLERSGAFGVGGRGSRGNNMGVLAAGAWPMSHHDEPVYYDRVSSGGGGGGGGVGVGGVSVSLSSSGSRRSMRVETKDCLNCHHQRQQSQQHLHHQQSNSQHHQHNNYIHHNQSSRHINEIGSGSVRNGRPLSVPPSMRMISSSSVGSMGCGSSIEATHMEMMPLSSASSSYNVNPNAGVPCRATLNGMQTASPPTCVPWLRKMKVIKKIQRKIGMG